jgi:hypothetical protein
VSISQLESWQQHAADFIAGLKPHLLGNESRELLNRRLDAFVRWVGKDDSMVKAWTGGVIDRMRPRMSVHRKKRFFERVATDRLRVCDEQMLTALVTYFRDWDPVVEFVEGVPPQGQTETKFAKLRRDLTKAIQNKWKDERASDAVQFAFEQLAKNAKEPHRGYTYDRDLLAWLIVVARNEMKSKIAEDKLFISLTEIDNPDPDD